MIVLTMLDGSKRSFNVQSLEIDLSGGVTVKDNYCDRDQVKESLEQVCAMLRREGRTIVHEVPDILVDYTKWLMNLDVSALFQGDAKSCVEAYYDQINN